ncbi:MAG: DUF3185 family protein [Planctomycetes bacterium]|nr:DUF3185 family protein [Planctomycetota bacterium]
MNAPISIALLVVGVILLVFGFMSADSLGSQFSKFFTGHPTDKTMWLLIGGAAATVVGLVGLARRKSA